MPAMRLWIHVDLTHHSTLDQVAKSLRPCAGFIHQVFISFALSRSILDRVTADSVTVSSPMIQNCSASIVRRFVHSFCTLR